MDYSMGASTEVSHSGALQSACRLIRDGTAAGTSGRTPCIAPALHVVSADVSLQLFFLEISAACLKMYFEENPPANQSLCRAYLSQGQLKSLPATGSMEDIAEALVSFLKAIEISKNEPRFHFMVFNASVQYFQTVYPLLQPGRCLHLVPSLRQVVQGLEEVADEDHSWRAELMMHLIECLVDSGEMEEAADLAKTTEELIKCQAPHLYPRLFMIMVQHKLTEVDVISEMSRKDINLAVIYKLQEFKKLNIITKEELMKDSVELEEIFHLLVDCTKVSTTPENLSALHSAIPIKPADRVAFLLELALMALQVKHHKVATDCLKELKLAREASTGQRIIMECVNSEINRLKKEAKINDYSKANVEAWLKEIGRLDQWLQSAVREGDPQAVQVVCATLWRFCLPLLQHNLRKHIKTPLLRVARVLEDAQSSLLEMRCQVHSELAVIEEEEGCLEASLTHLQKAILLDNGTQSQRLSWALHLLQLRKSLYQAPSRTEDKAAKLLQQAREMRPQDKTNIRPILVAVGLHLGPDDFQIVLDGDNISKIPVSHLASGSVAQLSAKAQHHSTCLQKVDGHLARQAGDTNNTERMKLWASLAKTARKQEVWDVCRAACRFCLLYDDGRRKISKADKMDECRSSEEESCAEPLHSCSERQNSVRDNLRLLAEIRFISAEATVQKLLTEGMQLNIPAVPPQERGVYVSEEDPDWVIYRDWILALSTYATFNFLRAAELGSAIGESWVVANAAIYLWNYNSQLLASGEYQHLLPSFQNLVEMLQKMECPGNRALVVLLCNAVARGLIQPWCGTDIVEPTLPVDKGKNKGEKRGEKAAAVHGVLPDHAALENVRKALELCDYAFHISTCNVPGEAVPIAARKQVVATWVHVKWLLQQQIGTKIDVKDECVNEVVSAMTRVLVGVEMLQCNRNPGHMEFSAPCLQTLVGMATECSWTDAVVELQVWSQLAAFCHYAKDHSLVLCCSKSALQLEEAAAKTINTMPCALYDLTSVNEMLSSAACLRGLSLVDVSDGDLHTYRDAMKVLLSSVSFAEKAKNPTLCVTAARHYWNSCVPLTQTPEGRRQLQTPLEEILNALLRVATKYTKKQVAGKGLLTLTTQTPGSSKPEGTDEEDLSLRSVIYSLLLQIRADKSDWKSGLQLLEKTERDMPPTKHSLPLLKSRILVKARLGESVLTDMEKLQDEGEPCSSMWHQVALCAVNRTQQLTGYQKAITSLQSSETQWQKVNLLLEFGEWLHCHNFPKADAQHQVQSAIDILLQLEPEQAEEADNKPKTKGLSEVEHEPLFAVEGLFTQNLSNLKGVQRLDCLVRAHTLLAVMTDRTSPEHQLNLLRAYTFVLHIWRVSMAGLSGLSCSRAKSPPQQPDGSKKVKDKSKKVVKVKDVKETTPAEERAKPGVPGQALPSSLEDWARYSCLDQTREIFRTNSSPDCINTQCITKQSQSLFYLNLLEKELHSLSLDHMTLPILHLAEVIAHDLLDNRSLSYVYRLRILRTCFQLGFETHSPYQRKLPDLCRVQEKEQMECHKMIAFSKEREVYFKAHNQKAKMDERVSPGRLRMDMCAQDIWLDKAEVLLSMGLCQPARQLLAVAHLMASKSGDHKAMARSLLSLASLACEEQNHGQALILLDEDQALVGDEEFWYQLALNKIGAVAGLRHQDAQTKVDQITNITNQSCGALKQILEQQVNRVSKLTFLITSLEMRGAMECIRAFGGGEPGETLSSEFFQMLTTACDTLRECASSFTKLNYRKQAAEAHAEYAHGVRLVSDHTTDKEEKQRLLLDGLSQMELAVTVQEHVVLNAQSLLPPQEETPGIWLAARQRLLRLRLVLAEYCLAMLEERCAEDQCQALSRERKTSGEIALEEFTRFAPEPGSVQQQWVSVGSTLGQVALGQLAAVSSHSSDNAETRARYLSLMGKCQRLMALQEDPLYLCALWDKHKHKEAWSNPRTIPVEEENSEKEKDGTEQRKISAKSAELQQRRGQAQQLLAQATKALTEAIDLCLQHKLPSSILADASINMLECQGQMELAATGQYLALFQSCSSVAMMAEVLNSACTDTSVSQLSALLNLPRKRLGFQEERPRSMLKGAEDSLNSLSKAFSQLTINPKHLQILTELPSNLKILLLQLSEDGSDLYGAFYEMTKPPENPKGKTTQLTGNLACSRVAKVSVSPQALLALREQVQALGQEKTHAPLKEAGWHGAEGRVKASEKDHLVPRKTDDEKLAPHFCKIVQEMEDYLKPLLTQFDSCLRLQDASMPCLEMTKSKDKEDKAGSDKLPTESGEYLVLLADTRLLELPLESLSILRKGSLSSVSRDFSLQLLHSRLNREQPDKDIVDPDNVGIFDGTSLSTRMKEIMETHSNQLTYPWEGFMGSKETPSPSEMEQLLCKSSAFIYLGKERFMANVPPVKLAALNLSDNPVFSSECRIALLFEQLLNNSSIHSHSILDTHRSGGDLALEKPLETALLLSLCGVGCVVLNQWHSSLQQNTHNMATVLDNLLGVRRTSGQTIHTLRRRNSSDIPQCKDKGSHDTVLLTDSKEEDVQHEIALKPSAFNCVLYGFPHLIFK